jgi:hypothetical protein
LTTAQIEARIRRLKVNNTAFDAAFMAQADARARKKAA